MFPSLTIDTFTIDAFRKVLACLIRPLSSSSLGALIIKAENKLGLKVKLKTSLHLLKNLIV